VGRQPLAIRRFRPLTSAERGQLEAEGAALLRFVHPDTVPDVRIT